MKAQKTLLAIALGLAASQTFADAISDGKFYADVTARFESADQDNGASKTANALIADTAFGYESKDFSGFKFLAEYEVVNAMIDNYAPETAGFDTVADPEVREWNRAQISYANDGYSAVLGRQRIILDNARFVGNVGWRANEQTFDAATVGYTIGDVAVKYSYIDQVNSILPKFDADVTDHLLNISYSGIKAGKLTAYAYLLKDDDTDAKNDTFGASFGGKTAVNDLSVIYSAEVATQSTDDFDALYYALEGGVVVDGITIALGNETLGSDSGDYGFQTPLATKHAFNGWADMFLATPKDGLSDTYLKVAGMAAGVKLVGIYHDFKADEGSNDYGSEIDLLAVKKLNDKFTVGAKYATYSAEDTYVDTDKFWLWAQAKF
jgi:hypothetical protein